MLADLSYFSILSNLDWKMKGLFFSYLATMNAIDQLSTESLFNPEVDLATNDELMKDASAAKMGYMRFITEASILSMSKIVEDVWVALRRDFGFKYNLWKPTVCVEFEKKARIVRALGNVIKHNESVIDRTSSRQAMFLVEDCGFPNRAEIFPRLILALGSPPRPMVSVPELMTEIYVFALDLTCKVAKQTHALLLWKEPERSGAIHAYLVPPFLRNLIRHPQAGSGTPKDDA